MGDWQQSHTAEKITIEPAGSSFEAFYAEVEPRLRRALTAACGKAIGAEATASAMSYGYEHWARVETMANPAGYLYRVGRNSVRGRRVRRLDLPTEAAFAGYDFEPGLPVALATLTEQQRGAVLLIVAWGWTLAEAAEVLGVSVSSVRNHLRRGMTKLREQMGVSDEG